MHGGETAGMDVTCHHDADNNELFLSFFVRAPHFISSSAVESQSYARGHEDSTEMEVSHEGSHPEHLSHIYLCHSFKATKTRILRIRKDGTNDEIFITHTLERRRK